MLAEPDLDKSDSEEEDNEVDTGQQMAWMGDCDSLSMD